MVVMGKLHIKNKRKGDAFVRDLTKERKRKQADVEIGEGAGKRLEKLEKKVEEQQDAIDLLLSRTGKLWDWMMEQEMK